MQRFTEFLMSLSLAFAGMFADELRTQTDAAAAGQTRAARVEFFQQRLSTLKAFDPELPARPFEFVETPLLSFDNPVSSIQDGFMFVWTERGRPVVAMKSYYNVPALAQWGRTFVSLAQRPIVMEAGDARLWSPQQAGIAFAPLPDSPRPADQPKLRLVQMRNLAQQFTVIDNWGIKNPTDWQLRLLTTPLFRYEAPEEGVVDGAMFGYVLSTSPEALVLLEARKVGEDFSWHYAVSRFTRFGITFSLGERRLAEFPRLDAWPPEGTYFHSPVTMPDYPFKNQAKPAAAKN